MNAFEGQRRWQDQEMKEEKKNRAEDFAKNSLAALVSYSRGACMRQ